MCQIHHCLNNRDANEEKRTALSTPQVPLYRRNTIALYVCVNIYICKRTANNFFSVFFAIDICACTFLSLSFSSVKRCQNVKMTPSSIIRSMLKDENKEREKHAHNISAKCTSSNRISNHARYSIYIGSLNNLHLILFLLIRASFVFGCAIAEKLMDR